MCPKLVSAGALKQIIVHQTQGPSNINWNIKLHQTSIIQECKSVFVASLTMGNIARISRQSASNVCGSLHELNAVDQKL